jgi:prepilin-type N-terminal cleavage/methylation domain-containing protein
MTRAFQRAERRADGFSLLELVISLTLVAVLMAVFLDRALYYRERAEKTAMEQVAQDLRSSVQLRVAELALNNRFQELLALAGENPFELLARKPQNYLGVLAGSGLQEVVTGNWYFDKTSKEAVYFVDLGENFTPDDKGRKRVAWHIVLVPGERGLPQWARFELVRPYRWF